MPPLELLSLKHNDRIRSASLLRVSVIAVRVARFSRPLSIGQPEQPMQLATTLDVPTLVWLIRHHQAARSEVRRQETRCKTGKPRVCVERQTIDRLCASFTNAHRKTSKYPWNLHSSRNVYWGLNVPKQAQSSFLKKKQRTFASAVADSSGERATAESKVFWSFFSKKDCLL